MRRAFVLAVGLASVLAFAVLPASAAQIGKPEKVPFGFTTTNPCNGELVTFTGVFNDIVTLTYDSSGGYHETIHFPLSDMHGIGSFGNNYSAGGGDNSISVAPSSVGGVTGFGGEYTAVSTFVMASHGSAPNFTMQVVQHITINPNDTWTANVDHESAVCHG